MSEFAPQVGAEELDELLEAVHGLDHGDDGMSVSDYLGSFLTRSQLDAVEQIKADELERGDSAYRLWTRISLGLMKHPAVVGNITSLAEVTLEEMDEPAWKNDGACKDNTDFVQPGRTKSPRRIMELIGVCQGCPVLNECHQYVKDRKPRYGFWAGATRGDEKVGYHEDDKPVTLAQNRKAVKKKMRRARAAKR